jgi:hypothetical protein
METIVVTHGPYKVIVREAKAVDGMRRAIMMQDGVKENPEKEEEEAVRLTRITAYPNSVCCSELVSGFSKPFTFEDYCELPYAFTDKWDQAVLQLNPAFYGIDPEVNEKKALKPDDGSGKESVGEAK